MIHRTMIHKIVGLIAVLVWAMCSLPLLAAEKGFRLLDATQYIGKPDMKRLGFENLTVVYGHFLWPGQKITDEVPAQSFLERRFREFGSFDGSPWCIDIEHWPMNGSDDEASTNATKLLSVLSAARRVNPSIQIGYYGEIPLKSYYPAIADRGSTKYKEWVRANLRNRHVADAVDVIFPSIYTFYNTPDEWVSYATRQIQMARVYGKPVYAFIWPQYHVSNEFHAFEFIDASFWRLQLETIYQHADGVVIWGGWDFTRNRRAKWDENAAWWKETEAFIARKSLAPVSRQLPPAAPDGFSAEDAQ